MASLNSPGARATRFYAGWAAVLLSGLGQVFVVGGPGAALPMIYGPIIDENGWPLSAVTAVSSIRMIAGVLLALSSGWLLGRFGLRAVVVGTSIAAGLSLIAFLGVHSIWTLYLVSFCVGGSTMLGLILFNIMVANWFNDRIGLATALASLGISVGGMITPFALSAIIPVYGWRAGMASLAPGILLLVAPAVLLFFRDPPAGIALDQKASLSIDAGPAVNPAPLGSTPQQIRATTTFWVAGLALMLSAAADQAMLQHLVLYLHRDARLSMELAAAALGLTFSGGFIGKMLFGYVFDRLSIYGLSLCYVMLGLSMLLMSPIFLPVIPVLLANSLRGVSHGGIIVDVPVAARHCFGIKPAAYVIGMWSAATTLGCAIGPYVVGLMRDHYGNYDIAFKALAGACILSAALILLANPAYRRAVRKLKGA